MRSVDAETAARRGQGGVVEAAVEKCTRVSRQTGCAMAWPNGGSGRAGRRRRSSGGGRQRVEEEGEGRCLYGGNLWHRVIKSPGTKGSLRYRLGIQPVPKESLRYRVTSHPVP